MARQMTTVERAARDAMKPYVQAKQLTQGEVNKIINGGLRNTEAVVRSTMGDDFGSAFYYGQKVDKARKEYAAAITQGMRMRKRITLMTAEIMAAVYKAVRAEYKTTEQIEQEDRETALLAAALEVVKEEVEEATASPAEENDAA